MQMRCMQPWPEMSLGRTVERNISSPNYPGKQVVVCVDLDT